MPEAGLLLHDVEVEGRPGLDVRIAGGRIVEIGPHLAGAEEAIDGRGGALIPGLIDHHIHLLATAAARESVALDAVRSPDAADAVLRAAASVLPAGGWVRATGYHEHHHGPLDRGRLDAIVPDHPVRVQHQTGSLWLLNGRALALAGALESHPTGWIERGDAWLRTRLGASAPSLARLGAELAAAGVTGVTDAGVANDDASARLLAMARVSGALPQRVMMMSGGPLVSPGEGIAIGPVKILLDDHRLPPFDDLLERIGDARRWGRPVAVHCVAAGELALTLAAFETAGAMPGDRIEHGGVIPAESIPVIAALGLTVVTQSGFVAERGDRYLVEVDPDERADLYRCASLRRAGIPVAGSSDAPYASTDPWAAMRAAVRRETAAGRPIGSGERIAPAEALGLYLGDFLDPGGAPRRVAVGAGADLCLLAAPLTSILGDLRAAHVAATIVDGRIIYRAARRSGAHKREGSPDG